MLSNIENIIDKYSLFINCSSVFTYPNVPLKKCTPAMASYASVITARDIILLYDDTALGGAKDGFIITKDRFFLKEAFESPKSIGASSISSIDYQSGVMSKKIIINKRKVFSATYLDKESIESIVLMMRELYCDKNSESCQSQSNNDDELM